MMDAAHHNGACTPPSSASFVGAQQRGAAAAVWRRFRPRLVARRAASPAFIAVLFGFSKALSLQKLVGEYMNVL